MGKKRALLIGINDYAPAGAGGSDLSGCVNDAADMAATLKDLGFTARSIKTVADGKASRSGILAGLRWLVKDAAADDSLVFYYSGHGSQVMDTDGDETDRRDEILCPHDIDFADRVYLTDDDLRGLFTTIPKGVNLEVILDSCHAGTGTRLPGKKSRIRYLPPPASQAIQAGVAAATRRLLARIPGGRRAVDGLNHTLWAACADNQTSEESEIGGTTRGVFTYHFCRELRRTDGEIDRKTLHKTVAAAIAKAGFTQKPQLETPTAELMEKPFVGRRRS